MSYIQSVFKVIHSKQEHLQNITQREVTAWKVPRRFPIEIKVVKMKIKSIDFREIKYWMNNRRGSLPIPGLSGDTFYSCGWWNESPRDRLCGGCTFLLTKLILFIAGFETSLTGIDVLNNATFVERRKDIPEVLSVLSCSDRKQKYKCLIYCYFSCALLLHHTQHTTVAIFLSPNRKSWQNVILDSCITWEGDV